MKEKFSAFKRFMVEGLLALKVYGDRLWTSRVEKELGWISFVLLLQFCLDIWAWTRTFGYALTAQDGASWWQAFMAAFMPCVLGFIFASAILAYDRGVVVMDHQLSTKASEGFRLFGKWRIPIGRATSVIAVRVVILIGLSMITAIPVELAVFKPEIDRRIEATEQRAVDGIRREAIGTEMQRYERELTAARATATSDVSTVNDRRTSERERLVQSQSAERARLAVSARELHDQSVRESRGGISGIPGIGDRYRAILRQAQDADQAVTDYNATAEGELQRFDGETRSQVDAAQGSRNASVSSIEHDHDQRLQALRAMAPADLQARYGGNYREARGFLQRFRVLEELRHENHTVALIVWGLRLLMVTFGILIVSLKLTSSIEMQQYFSLRAQAASGNKDAQDIVRSMGYTNFSAYGMSPYARDALTDFYKACRICGDALDDLRREVMRLAVEKDGRSRYTSQRHIQGKLHAFWMERVLPKLGQVRARAEIIRLEGVGGIENVDAPNWPTDLNNGRDPREIGYEPWLVSAAELASYGWVNPEPIEHDLKMLTLQCRDMRRELIQLIEETETVTVAMAASNASMLDMLQHRRADWSRKLLPGLIQLEQIESEITDRKGTLPEWPRHAPDPRPTLRDRVFNLREEDIAHWRGSAKAPVVNPGN